MHALSQISGDHVFWVLQERKVLDGSSKGMIAGARGKKGSEGCAQDEIVTEAGLHFMGLAMTCCPF